MSKHLAVLEEAGLLTTERVGREKRRYLNRSPIRAIQDRWITPFDEPHLDALERLRERAEVSMMAATVHRYETLVRASIETVWNALLDPEFTRRYLNDLRLATEAEPGAAYRFVDWDDVDVVAGTIEAIEPPHRLVLTWSVLSDTTIADESPGRVEWLLETADKDGTVTRVTLRHGDLALSPTTWGHAGRSWPIVLAGLKTLPSRPGAMSCWPEPMPPPTTATAPWFGLLAD